MTTQPSCSGAEDPKARKKSDDVAEVRMQFADFDGTEYQLERGDPVRPAPSHSKLQTWHPWVAL